MTKEYSAEENKIWRAAQPQKMIVAKVIIKSDKGTILLVKPDYKKTWQLPGGGVDNGESPEEAAIREVREEIGLSLSPNDLITKGTIYQKSDEVLFVLLEATKLISEDTAFTIQENEITNVQFVNQDNVAALLPKYYSNFWNQR